MMSSIFITGGSGFIGRRVVAALAKAKHRLYVLVRSEARLAEAMKEVGCSDMSSITAVRGDLTKPSLGLGPEDRQLLRNVDTIIHAGGPMDILLQEEEARQLFVHAAQEIAGLAKTVHDSSGLRHFIHVVGFKSPYSDRDNDSHAPTYDDRSDPPYEKMKFEADLLIRQKLHAWGIPLSVVNPSVVIGDSYTGMTEQTGGLGILVNAVRRNLMALAPGGPDYWLPLVHVDHVAAFISALAEEANPVSDTYYLLDDKRNSPGITELVRLIAREVRAAAPIGSIPPRLIKKLLNAGADKLLQLPGQSVDFIVQSEFPTASKRAIETKYDLNLSVNESALPFVITDLDYRLSHGAVRLPEPFRFHRRAGLATFESEGSGIPIVIVHGTFSSSLALLPMAQSLAKLGHPIYLADLPGFGRSPYHHRKAFGLQGFERAVEELIRSLDSKVILVGHSFGGYLAAKMLETIPDRIEKAVLLQPVLQSISSRYRSSFRTQTGLQFLSESSLKKKMLQTKSFATAEEIPESYLSYVHNECKSTRVRKTTAEVMSGLSRPEHITVHPARWNPKQVAILWGTTDTEHALPRSMDAFRVTPLPYAHQFPISHPEAAARSIQMALKQ
jgi:nucleoside-diphosphate-sugar epimerase/pimeloyl-ACP methyl ester carboxylesterase